jgi:hypothetical protein
MMTRSWTSPTYRGLAIVAAAAMLVTSGGCVLDLMAVLLYENKTPAKYSELKESKVAVVCISESSVYQPLSAPSLIAHRVEELLALNVKDIEIVDQGHVRDWIDNNDWNDTNYREIGEGLGVDKLVAVDIGRFELYDGQSMYRGRADVRVSVFEMDNNGKEKVVAPSLPMTFPKVSTYSVTDMEEYEFRAKFVEYMAHNIAKNFYSYDINEDLALDATMITQ